MPRFDSIAAAVAAGIPDEIDGVPLDLAAMNVIGDVVDELMDRNVRMTLEGVVRFALKAFVKTYEPFNDAWRPREVVHLSGSQQLAVQRSDTLPD